MMEEGPKKEAVTGEFVQIGVSRPPLPVTDLPEPEEVFHIKGRIGPKQLVLYVLGPSMIALGISIGSGEWLVGPRTVGGAGGFVGIGWVVLVSALLQVFYNVELGRFTVATGEAPVVAFGRVPPGLILWTPLAVGLFYLAFIWGGWAANAGESLFPLIFGRARTAAELPTVKALGAGLLLVVFVITLFGKKISRTLEIANWIMVVFILVSVAIIAIIVVPATVWGSSFASLVIPAAPPSGTSATNLGALAGFTALASGLNYVAISSGFISVRSCGPGRWSWASSSSSARSLACSTFSADSSSTAPTRSAPGSGGSRRGIRGGSTTRSCCYLPGRSPDSCSSFHLSD